MSLAFANRASNDLPLRLVPLGFAFRDASDLALIADGLEVTIADKVRPFRRARLLPSPAGVWTTPRLPGLGANVADDLTAWASRPFEVRVSDPLRRFLPLRFDAALPARARFQWPGWTSFKPPAFAPIWPVTAAPSGYKMDYLPLFPSIARTLPGPRATVRAQLVERQTDGSDKPCSWAMVSVKVGGKVIALGMADGGGSVAACGAYPALPVQAPADAAKGRKQVIWDAEIAVHWDELAGDPPDLSAILAQLASPARIALKEFGKADALPKQKLVLGQPLTLVSEKAPLSALYLKPN